MTDDTKRIAVIIGIGLLAIAAQFALFWWLDRREARRIEQQMQRWAERRPEQRIWKGSR